MGMFDLDKTLGRGVRLTEKFPSPMKFVVWGVVEILEVEIPGSDIPGAAEKVILDCSSVNNPEDRFEAGVIGSAIAAKAKEADESEFPAVVHLDTVQSSIAGGNDALILVYDYDYDPEKETILE